MGILTVLRNKWLIRAYAFLLFIALWQLSGMLASPIDFAPPLAVLGRMESLWLDTSNVGLPANILITLQTLIVGVIIASAGAIPLGMLMGRNENIEYAVDPYIAIIYAIPGVILFPFMIVWLGFNIIASYALVVIGPFFPLVINTMAGVKNVSRSLVETGRSFGYERSSLWRKIILPASVPYIVTGMRLGLASAILSTLVAEIFITPSGLGYLLDYYSFSYDIPATLAVTVIVMIFGFVVAEMAKYFERRIRRSVGAIGI